MTSVLADAGARESIADGNLCAQCCKLNLRHYLAPLTLRLHWSLPDAVSFDNDLKLSTSSGCNLCRLLAWSLSSTGTDIPMQIKMIKFEQLGQTETLSGNPTASLCISPCGSYSQRLAPLGRTSFRLGARRYTYGRMIQTDRACRELVTEWLQKCNHEHRGACSAIPPAYNFDDFVPEYLIDVQEMRVHQVSGNDLKYLALSYVWGQIQTLQLLTDNKIELASPGSLRDRIDEIPMVIRDAIAFTNEIGYKFLWVDSLCICQDNENTKERQIARMNTVYARASMTLVALEGIDASYGLPGVQSYETPRFQPVENVHQLRMMTILPPLSESLERSVWRTRAWTFQEEQFSRRLLFFTKHQVYFRCQSSTSCEDRYEDCVDVSQYSVEGAFHDGLLHHPHRGALLLTTANRLWISMVEDYSKRNFSRDSDRHNAFSGIESELSQGKLNYPCTLGMPIKHLARQLYWHHLEYSTSKQHESRRIECYPSWSWCGWGGAIVLPRVDLHTAITKIHISGENVVHIYDEKGVLVRSTSTEPPSQIPVQVPEGRSTRLLTLSFEAHISRLRLDTSRFSQDGVILISPKRGKICGVLHCAHLSLESLIENMNDLECILIASCHRGGKFRPCRYLRNGNSEITDWFLEPIAEPFMKHGNVTEVYNRVLRPPLPPSQGMSTLNHDPETNRLGLNVRRWKRRLTKIFWSHNPVSLLIGTIVVSALILAALVIALILAVAGLVVAIFTVIFIFLALFILVLPLLWVYQRIHNIFTRKNKWYAWDALSTTRFGEWLDEVIVQKLPERVQNGFYQGWSGSPDRASHQRREEPSLYNVANIMLVRRRVIDGDEVYERLAIGEMDIRCWWESRPICRELLLQ